MTLIESLLMLPEYGEPIAATPEIDAALARASDKFVCLRGTSWHLTVGGRRFLAQFRPRRADIVRRLIVRLVLEGGQPLFYLFCDDETIVKATKADLQRRLGAIRAANPDVKIIFEYGRSDSVP